VLRDLRQQGGDHRVHPRALPFQDGQFVEQGLDLQLPDRAERGHPQRVLGALLERGGFAAAEAAAAGSAQAGGELVQIQLGEGGRTGRLAQEHPDAGAKGVGELVGELREDAVEHHQQPALGITETAKPAARSWRCRPSQEWPLASSAIVAGAGSACKRSAN